MSAYKRVYLAGPMTGIPQFNFPTFDAAADDLRERGFIVVSPAELDAPETRAAALASPDGDLSAFEDSTRETWGTLLARDVQLVADEVDGVVVLDGWRTSRGARLEVFVARLCGKPVMSYPDLKDVPEVADPWVLYEQPPQRVEDGGCHDFPLADGEVRVTNASTGGQKGRKPERMALLPLDVLMRDVAPLYAAGALKYDDHNWRRGYDWSLSADALLRHFAQFWHGEDRDAETGAKHLASVVFHALALCLFMDEHAELDDRPSAEVDPCRI